MQSAEERTMTMILRVVAAMILVAGCSAAPTSQPPSVASPRYQLEVVRSDGPYNYVYRMDTATGEIETFMVTSPEFIERASPRAADLLNSFHKSMRFIPGSTLASKGK
jgi:hypothetical protein